MNEERPDRITITHDKSITARQAMWAAGYAIDFWEKETEAGRPWCPGAIAVYQHPDLGDTIIATSTTKTAPGWSVKMYRQTTMEKPHADD